MRDPKRIQKIINILEEIWELAPDLRLGQIIVTILGTDPFYIEDNIAEMKLTEFLNQLKKNN